MAKFQLWCSRLPADLQPFDLTERGSATAHQASEGALGRHPADQRMLPLALAAVARGREAYLTCTEMTEHATTNIGVIERFLPVRFDAETSGTCPRVRVTSAANL
jgi:RNA 3'-terminal phosphate cyclase (ATP)